MSPRASVFSPAALERIFTSASPDAIRREKGFGLNESPPVTSFRIRKITPAKKEYSREKQIEVRKVFPQFFSNAFVTIN